MNSTQRLIKYLATGFAIFLSITIITSIAGGFYVAFNALSITSDERVSYNKTFQDVENLSIECSSNSVTIKEGSEFKVEASNVSENYKVKLESNGTLKLYNDGFQFEFFNFVLNESSGTVTIYLPTDFTAKKTYIDAGTDNLTINHLKTDRLELNGSVGNINGSDITANEADLDASVGNLTLSDINITNSDIDGSVGNISLTGSLLGTNSIDGSTGNITLHLTGSSDDYNIKADTSLGNLKLNGKEYSDFNWNNTTADNTLKIDGSIGNISIDFSE